MDPVAVQKTVETFADFLLRYFVALAAVGALAMALIELWKKLLDSRTRFHAKAVTHWLQQKDPDASAYAELIHLTSGVAQNDAERAARYLNETGEIPVRLFRKEPDPAHALFALDIERMMGHIQEAADMALNNPNRYPKLFVFATAGAGPDDVHDWFAKADAVPKGDTFDRDDAKRRADLYARLSQVVKRKLDAFQLYTGDRWRNANQLWANVVGAFVLLVTLLWIKANAGDETTGLTYGVIFLISLFGGILAPLAKDVVVALQRVRSG